MAFLQGFQARSESSPEPESDSEPAPSSTPAVEPLLPVAQRREVSAQEQAQMQQRNQGIQSVIADVVQQEQDLTAAGAERKKIAKVMQWEPPNILDKKRFPEIYQIYKTNDLVSPFLYSVNASMLNVCVAVSGIAKVRDAMTKVMKLNGGSNAESSEHIANVVGGSQEAVSLIADQVGAFVVAMAKTASETGKMSFALQFGADPTKLAEGLKKAIANVVKQDAEMDKRLKAACDGMERSLKVLHALIQRDDAVASIDKELRELGADFQAKDVIVTALDKEYHEKRAPFESQQAVAQEEIEQADKRIAKTEKRAKELTDQWKVMEERRKACDERVEKLSEEKTQEEAGVAANQTKILADLQKMAHSFEAANKQAHADAQKQMTKMQSSVSSLEQLWKSADGGGTTTEYSGWWIFSSRRKTVSRKDQKAPIKAMMQEREQRLADMRKREAARRQEDQDRLAKLARENADFARKQKEEKLKCVGDRFKEKRQEVFEQQGRIAGFMKQVDLQRQQLAAERAELDTWRKEAKGRKQEATSALTELDSQLLTKLKHAEQQRDAACNRLCDKQDERDRLLKQISEKFGQDQYTFQQFMRLLSQLLARAKNMTLAFKTITKSVEAAQASFGTDFFYEQMALVPDEHKGKAMQLAAQHFQKACFVGQTALQMPLNALMLRDEQQAALEDAGGSGQPAQAALPQASGAWIEEVA